MRARDLRGGSPPLLACPGFADHIDKMLALMADRAEQSAEEAPGPGAATGTVVKDYGSKNAEQAI